MTRSLLLDCREILWRSTAATRLGGTESLPQNSQSGPTKHTSARWGIVLSRRPASCPRSSMQIGPAGATIERLQWGNPATILHDQKIEAAERMEAVASLPKRLSLRRWVAERISAAQLNVVTNPIVVRLPGDTPHRCCTPDC